MAALAAVVVLALQTEAPDSLIVNGRVFTGTAAAPWAEAIAVRGDRIVAVGTTAALRATAGPQTQVIDVRGHLVLPGLNDAHTHVGARPPGVQLRLDGNDPLLDDVLAAIKSASATAAATEWIYGTIGERVLSDPRTTRFALDEAAPGRIVKLSAWTGHGNILSTAAMKALGIGEREPDPPFGRYGRTSDGVVNGLLEEYADVRANRAMTRLAGRAAAVDGLRRLASEASRYGITTIQAMANSLPARELVSMLRDAATGIRWRVIRFPIALDEADDPDSYAALPAQSPPHVTVSGTKWILDGTPVERLAAMNEAYADRPGSRGRLNLPPAAIERILRRGLEQRDQVLLHIAGDAGVDAVLSAMERIAPAAAWQAARLRIEHGDMVSGARIARARSLGVVIVQNPVHFTLPAIMGLRLGAARAEQLQPVKAIVEAGVPLALGGDGPLNPFLNMMFAIQHPDNPRQALTREQVVLAYTAGSAYAEFAEREKGRIAPGMLADIVALDRDIFSVPVDQLPATEARLTMVAGKVLRIQSF